MTRSLILVQSGHFQIKSFCKIIFLLNFLHRKKEEDEEDEEEEEDQVLEINFTSIKTKK